MKVKTRYKCKIIGSDYSAQEPRMNAHICEAYTNLPNKYYIDPALLPDKITSKADIFEIPDDSFSNTEYLVRLFEKEMAKNSDDIDAAWDAVKAVINDPARNPKLCVNKMKEAYMADKDLYAMIAQSAYNNEYADNLEFYPEGTELEIDGKKVIAGSGKEFQAETDELNSITVPTWYLVPTERGDISANEVTLQDKVESDQGFLEIRAIEPVSGTLINDKPVANLKIVFK